MLKTQVVEYFCFFCYYYIVCTTFLLSSLFFFFLKIWSEIGIRIIHGPALYTGKYGRCLHGHKMSENLHTVL